MANTQGKRGDNRTQSRWQGKKISKGTLTVSGKKPSQGFSHQYFCSTCNNRNASKAEDITEWAPYLDSDDSEPEQSKNYMMKRQKRQTEGRSHLMEEILKLRGNSTSWRKPVSEAGV